MRLSTRFALCVAGLVSLLVLLTGFLVLKLASHDLRDERDRQLSSRLTALVPVATAHARWPRVLAPLPALRAKQRIGVAATGDDGSGGAYVQVSRGGENLIFGKVPSALPEPQEGPGTFTHNGMRWRFVTVALGARGAAGRLWIFEPEDRLDARLVLLRRRVALVTIIATVAGAAAGLVLGWFAARPLTVLRRQARTIDLPSPQGVRLTTASGVAEIDELARLVNELLDRRDAAVTRTGEALETSRAFAATAAHELRTPLTSMSANISLLGHPNLTDIDRAEIIADLAVENGRIQRLIAMLRRLARGELLDPATFASVDLTELIDVAVEDARHRHPHAVVSAALDEGSVAWGWAEGLRMIVDNLLDNAGCHGVDSSGQATVE